MFLKSVSNTYWEMHNNASDHNEPDVLWALFMINKIKQAL